MWLPRIAWIRKAAGELVDILPSKNIWMVVVVYLQVCDWYF